MSGCAASFSRIAPWTGTARSNRGPNNAPMPAVTPVVSAAQNPARSAPDGRKHAGPLGRALHRPLNFRAKRPGRWVWTSPTNAARRASARQVGKPRNRPTSASVERLTPGRGRPAFGDCRANLALPRSLSGPLWIFRLTSVAVIRLLELGGSGWRRRRDGLWRLLTFCHRTRLGTRISLSFHANVLVAANRARNVDRDNFAGERRRS